MEESAWEPRTPEKRGGWPDWLGSPVQTPPKTIDISRWVEIDYYGRPFFYNIVSRQGRWDDPEVGDWSVDVDSVFSDPESEVECEYDREPLAILDRQPSILDGHRHPLAAEDEELFEDAMKLKTFITNLGFEPSADIEWRDMLESCAANYRSFSSRPISRSAVEEAAWLMSRP